MHSLSFPWNALPVILFALPLLVLPGHGLSSSDAARTVAATGAGGAPEAQVTLTPDGGSCFVILRGEQIEVVRFSGCRRVGGAETGGLAGRDEIPRISGDGTRISFPTSRRTPTGVQTAIRTIEWTREDGWSDPSAMPAAMMPAPNPANEPDSER